MSVEGKEAVDLTISLLRESSVNPPAETAGCAGVVRDYFEKNGIKAEFIESQGVTNVVARLSGRAPGKTLVLNGHIDVVPPGEGWTVDPFGGLIRDGFLYGRGACDMKSGIAALAAAMVGFKRSGPDFDGDIIFMGVGDEETGSRNGTIHLLEAGLARGADMAIVAEPTDLEVQLGNRGLRWIDVEVIGKSCHAGRPHLGLNAIAKAARLIEAVQTKTYTLKDDRFEVSQPSISVTMINGGTKVNVIPNRCRLSIDRRMLPGETREMVKEEIEELIAGVLEKEDGFEINYEVHPGLWDPYVISAQEPVVSSLIESFSRVVGREPVITTKGACTDGSHLYHLGGMPTVLFGPGDQNLSHQVDECVRVENIETATRVLMDTLENLFA